MGVNWLTKSIAFDLQALYTELYYKTICDLVNSIANMKILYSHPPLLLSDFLHHSN